MVPVLKSSWCWTWTWSRYFEEHEKFFFYYWTYWFLSSCATDQSRCKISSLFLVGFCLITNAICSIVILFNTPSAFPQCIRSSIISEMLESYVWWHQFEVKTKEKICLSQRPSYFEDFIFYLLLLNGFSVENFEEEIIKT